MRLALQSATPGLVEQLQGLALSVGVFVFPSTDDPREGITADAIPRTAAGGVNQPAFARSYEDFRVIHFLWRVFLGPHISWRGPNMIELFMAPFFANEKAFSNIQPLEAVVDKAAGH